MNNDFATLAPPPRKARLQRGIRNLRHAYRSLLGLIIFVLAGWAGLDAWRLYELTHGTALVAGAIAKKTLLPRPSGAEHRLDYTFTPADGVPIHDSTSVAAAEYAAVNEGDRVNVVYLVSNPAEHWLHDNESARAHPRFMLLSRGLAALVALVVLLLIERPLRRELWLARHGIVCQGTITATGRGRRRRSKPWIAYAFKTADGAAVEGKSYLPRATPADALMVGAPVEVLYDATQPRWNRPRLAMASIEF